MKHVSVLPWCVVSNLLLRQQLSNHLAMHVGQAAIDAVVAKDQPFGGDTTWARIQQLFAVQPCLRLSARQATPILCGSAKLAHLLARRRLPASDV